MKRRYEIILEIDSDEIDVSNTIRNKFKFDFKSRIVDIKNVKETRSSQQNAALHLWYTQLAQELRDKGFSVRDILKEGINVEWTPVLVKEIMWRRLQNAMFGKISTTQLFKGGEIDNIYDEINRLVIERTNGKAIVPPFPSFENM